MNAPHHTVCKHEVKTKVMTNVRNVIDFVINKIIHLFNKKNFIKNLWKFLAVIFQFF